LLDRRPQEAVQVMLALERDASRPRDLPSIETLTGGYLYDRRLLDHLVSHGDRAEVIDRICLLDGPATDPPPDASRPALTEPRVLDAGGLTAM
jgi:hypothetical protein